MINLNLDSISDPILRENFENIVQEFGINPFLNGDLRHFEAIAKKKNNQFKFKHNLGFIPHDILISHIMPQGVTVKVVHEKTNVNFITFDVSGPCKFRFFAGLISTTKPVDIEASDNGGGGGGGSETYLIDSTPVGTVLQFSGEVLPENYIWAHNQELSRTAYAELFAVVGTSFGEGDGSTTFNAPDMRGLFARGVDGTANRDPDKATRTAINTGGNTGDNVGSYQDDELKSHEHKLFANQGRQVNTNNSNVYIGENDSVCATNWNPGGIWNAYATQPSTNGIKASRGVSSLEGGSETRPKNIYYNYIVKYTMGSAVPFDSEYWGPTVPSFNLLPAKGTNGELRQVYDEKKIYRWNAGSSTWEPFGDALASLSDVNISSPSDGDMLVYNSTSGKWENAANRLWTRVVTSSYANNTNVNPVSPLSVTDELIVGKLYKLSVTVNWFRQGNNGINRFYFIHDGASYLIAREQTNNSNLGMAQSICFYFIATATSISFQYAANANNHRLLRGTSIVLEEMNNIKTMNVPAIPVMGEETV